MNVNPFIDWKTFTVRSCGGLNLDLYTLTGDANDLKLLHYTVQIAVGDGTVHKILNGEGKGDGWKNAVWLLSYHLTTHPMCTVYFPHNPFTHTSFQLYQRCFPVLTFSG